MTGSRMKRALLWLLLTPVFIAVAVIGMRVTGESAAPPPAQAVAGDPALPSFTAPEPRDGPPPAAASADCAEAGPAGAVEANAASLRTAPWSAFGRAELGWEIYAPHVAAEIGAAGCEAASPGFAAALARWQGSHRLTASGVLDEATLQAMATAWALQRPFVQLNRTGVCPEPPSAGRMAALAPSESYGGKAMQLRPAALAAWRRLVADARAQVPAVDADKTLLMIVSAFRDPAADAARCEAEQNCEANLVRTSCSAHRTGLAIDVYLGAAPGYDPISSADANRLYQTRGPAYRWLVANAGRYGFVNYAFEPWHWEWTGEPVQ